MLVVFGIGMLGYGMIRGLDARQAKKKSPIWCGLPWSLLGLLCVAQSIA